MHCGVHSFAPLLEGHSLMFLYLRRIRFFLLVRIDRNEAQWCNSRLKRFWDMFNENNECDLISAGKWLISPIFRFF